MSKYKGDRRSALRDINSIFLLSTSRSKKLPQQWMSAKCHCLLTAAVHLPACITPVHAIISSFFPSASHAPSLPCCVLKVVSSAAGDGCMASAHCPSLPRMVPRSTNSGTNSCHAEIALGLDGVTEPVCCSCDPLQSCGFWAPTSASLAPCCHSFNSTATLLRTSDPPLKWSADVCGMG